MQTNTSEHETPFNWREDYLRKLIEKNAVVKKRRDKIQKSKMRYTKF